MGGGERPWGQGREPGGENVPWPSQCLLRANGEVKEGGIVVKDESLGVEKFPWHGQCLHEANGG